MPGTPTLSSMVWSNEFDAIDQCMTDVLASIPAVVSACGERVYQDEVPPSVKVTGTAIIWAAGDPGDVLNTQTTPAAWEFDVDVAVVVPGLVRTAGSIVYTAITAMFDALHCDYGSFAVDFVRSASVGFNLREDGRPFSKLVASYTATVRRAMPDGA